MIDKKIFEQVIYTTDRFSINFGKLKDDKFINHLNESGYKNFCFITPQNPCNKIIDCESNEKRLKDLELDLKDFYYEPCLSRHSYLDYPPEEGFIIYDISLDESVELQKKYEQVAIVYGDKKECELIY